MIDDPESFIFTLKNPHGVEPTRYMKKVNSKGSLIYKSDYGPIIGYDIVINNHSNKWKKCYVCNPSRFHYECHPTYKSSLFVNTAGPDNTNFFSVLDYEVYCTDNDSKYTIDHLCKYPDIIWKCIQGKHIFNYNLKKIKREYEIIKDLNIIHCTDIKIRLMMSKYFLKYPSRFLHNTQIVSIYYDSTLREWLGNDYKWKLIYRASKHNFSSLSFHKCCDDKGPTLVIIKSTEGWIFGGYTTQSWSGESISNDNLFTFQ